MNFHFFTIINIILITRLSLMKNVKTNLSLSIVSVLWLSLLPAFFILAAFRTTRGSLLMLSLILAIYFTLYCVEKIAHQIFLDGRAVSLSINLARFLSFLALFILSGIWSANQANLITRPFIGFFHPATQSLTVLTAPFDHMGWKKVGAVVMGLLIVTNEVNIFFRFVIDAFNISHPKNDKNTIKGDENEYNTGRLIGILERIIVYFLVIIGRYEAIGFIMAAKTFTRFKELDNREFAEYVLIGTLLSITLSVATALYIKRLILILP